MFKVLPLLVVLLIPALVFAHQPDASKCKALVDAIQRVDCYDQLFESGATASSTTPQEADFGLPAVVVKQDKPREMAQTITSVKRGPLGHLILELDNAQVWAQVDKNRLKLNEGTAVIIRAGVGGSHYLRKGSGSRSLKVKRVK